ncbi:hypothetical protein [Duganella sp. Root1480D1]|uniref:hypothetical protein n=1 Tax=Duganella sp. Root1480D1 TaxID=1736471 RepID=UPI000A3F1CE1|nr:hypothetical protein [Duganella sp. Root1480D1]
MRSILLCGLLAFSVAQAAVLPESTIQKMAPKVKAGCMRSAVTPEFTKELQSEVCSCSEQNYVAKLRVAEFSNTQEASKEDRERLMALEEKAVAECIIPPMQRNLEKSTLADCLADPKSLIPSRKLPTAKVKLVCACAAERYSKSVDLLEAGRAKDKNAVEKKMAALWMTSVDACIANKP